MIQEVTAYEFEDMVYRTHKEARQAELMDVLTQDFLHDTQYYNGALQLHTSIDLMEFLERHKECIAEYIGGLDA